ncbi:hypothetical protein CDAR_60741 [Caerostris darwini]|uniref:Uncharacterized protein n=1 Tax=Caerostris darwini TaxID=1538125 RepID=A0AAV4VI44_9ARAC|nr:hypothetical protein CDAR_60741 [Caerostris darwini]
MASIFVLEWRLSLYGNVLYVLFSYIAILAHSHHSSFSPIAIAIDVGAGITYISVRKWLLSLGGNGHNLCELMASIPVWEWPLSLCGNGLYLRAGMASISVQ